MVRRRTVVTAVTDADARQAGVLATGVAVGPVTVLALGAGAGVLDLLLSDPTARWLRAALWVVAGATAVARARHRPEPTASWTLFGVAAAVLAVAWSVAAPGAAAALPTLTTVLVALGLAGTGAATLLATPGWRRRVALLDGVAVALCAATVLLLVVLGAGGAPTDRVGTVLVGLVAALVAPSVATMAGLQGELLPTRSSVAVVAGLLCLLVGGSVVALAAGGLATADRRAGLLFTVAAVLGAVAAAQRPGPRRRAGRLADGRPSVRRLVGMVLVVVLPAVAAAALDLLVVASLAVSLLAALVLALRLAASSAVAVAEVEEQVGVRFDALVENAAEVMALLDDRRRIVYVSGAVRATFGMEPERFVGRPPSDIIAAADASALEEVLGRASSRPGVPARARLRLKDDDRRQRHVDVTVVDMLDVPGVGAIAVTIQDVTQRVALEAELVRQAQTDSLTGLVNRAVLTERVDHALGARRSSAALLFIDVDGFKLINDGYGHDAGDMVLRMLASRLRSVLREHDTAARMGGDEFVVLLEELTDTPFEDAATVADRIHLACDRPVVIDGEPVDVAVSVGIAVPDGETTAEQLIASSDAAMYVAKGQRRGTVVYEEGMRISARSRLRLMRDVRAAIEDGDLHVDYQPIVHAESGELDGVEALLRWTHPEMGAIRPDLILEHAAAAGRTQELTLRILRTVADDLAGWRTATGRSLSVSVNLSAQQLLQVDPEEVLRLLGGPEHGDATLTLEVTETSLLGDLTAAADVLAQFRAAGCHVAIDDFGTGYASIGYLRELPLDRLKIDRDFVTGLRAPTAAGSFAALIQNLASSLGLRTVAEGVESLAELEAVRVLGCDFVQGFLYSRGLPMAELIAWATDRDGAPVADVSPPA